MPDHFDPEDPGRNHSDFKISLFWILLPVFLIFAGIIGLTLYHLQHQDFLRQ